MNCTTCNTYLSTQNCKVCGVITETKKPIKIRRMSKRLETITRVYNRLRIQFLKLNPRCAVYPNLRATECHHSRGRGVHLNNMSTWVAVSQEGHKKIELNPKWARENGFAKSRL